MHILSSFLALISSIDILVSSLTRLFIIFLGCVICWHFIFHFMLEGSKLVSWLVIMSKPLTNQLDFCSTPISHFLILILHVSRSKCTTRLLFIHVIEQFHESQCEANTFFCQVKYLNQNKSNRSRTKIWMQFNSQVDYKVVYKLLLS